MRYLLFVVCLFITNNAFAQLSVYSGFNGGINSHTFTVNDQNGVLQPGMGEEYTFGIPIIVAKGSWSIQTGIFSNNLTRAYYFKTPDGEQYGDKYDDESSISTLKIPLIFGKEFKLVNRVSIAPKVGLVWLTDRSKSDSTEIHKGTLSGENFMEIESVSNVVNKNKFMAEAGLDINIYPFRHLMIIGGVSYSYGLQPIEDTYVTYKLGDEEFTEVLESKGSGLNFHVGIRIPILTMHGGHHRDLFD